MSESPYVRYRVTSDLTGKGLGYSLKKAIIGYLRHHNLQGNLTGLMINSSTFEAVLELFPGDVSDLNTSSLLRYISKSGLLPASKHPLNITVEPIIPILTASGSMSPAEYKTDEQWGHAIKAIKEEYDQQMQTANSTIDNLTRSLRERQEVISRFNAQKRDLEKMLENAGLIDNADPVKVIARRHVGPAYEGISETIKDYEALKSNEDIELFRELVNERASISIINYVNKKYGTNLSSQDELTSWSNGEEGSDWHETETGKSLINERETLIRDQAILERAEKTGASKEVIEAIRFTMSAKRHEDIEKK